MSDVVIVGGGIAGLAAAWELVQRGQRPIVLEQSPRPGGVILTETINGFVVDAGPDALLIQKPAALDLCRELGLGGRLFSTRTPRTAYVLRNRTLVALPEASFLGIPTRIGPFVSTRLFSWRGKIRMALEPFFARGTGEDESIGGFIGRRFGQEAVTYLAEPLLAGIHAGDVQRLSMRALFPRLLDLERTYGSVLRGLSRSRAGASTDGAFMSLPGGIAEMVVTLVSRLPADTIRCQSTVTGIDGTGPYRVFMGNESIEARAVILAAPAWAVAAMVSRIDRALSETVGSIRYVSSATIGVAFRREQVRHPLNGSGFVVPRPERRTLMAGTWVSSKWPSRAPEGSVLLRGFVGGASDPEALSSTDAELSRSVVSELAELLGISGDPLFTRVYRWPRANAQHEVGHLDRIAEIDARLARFPGLFVTGRGFRGSGIPDCVADARRTAAAAARFLAGASG